MRCLLTAIDLLRCSKGRIDLRDSYCQHFQRDHVPYSNLLCPDTQPFRSTVKITPLTFVDRIAALETFDADSF